MAFHSFIKDENGWQTLARKPLFLHQYLEVHQVKVASPSRPAGFEWTVCHRKAGVVVMAETSGGGFVMIRQERVPVQRSLWEFPAGQIDEVGSHDWEAVVAAGLRELEEESGYHPGPGGDVVPMHLYFSSPGFTDEHCYQVWVRGVELSPRGAHRDPNEVISEVRVFSAAEIQQMVLSGEICDANTLSCVARLWAGGALGKGSCGRE